MGIQPIGAFGNTHTVQNIHNIKKLSPVAPVKSVKQNDSFIEKLNEETVSRRRFDYVDFKSNETPPDFKAIALIKKSEISPPEPPKPEERRQRVEIGTENRQPTEEIQPEKIAENKRTDEKEKTLTTLTPAQKEGFEIYRKFQNYSSPLNMSNARMAV